MHEQAIAIYCICEEVVNCFGLKDDSQCKMTTGEVMAFAMISAVNYQCDYQKTRLISMIFRFFPKILSHSRLIRPGGLSDIQGLKTLSCELPFGATLLGDRAYTSYSLEDDLLEMAGITLLPKRKNNLKRQNTNTQDFIISQKRNLIESVFSAIVCKMPRYIKAKTESGFYLKVLLFIIAYLAGKAFPLV